MSASSPASLLRCDNGSVVTVDDKWVHCIVSRNSPNSETKQLTSLSFGYLSFVHPLEKAKLAISGSRCVVSSSCDGYGWLLFRKSDSSKYILLSLFDFEIPVALEYSVYFCILFVLRQLAASYFWLLCDSFFVQIVFKGI